MKKYLLLLMAAISFSGSSDAAFMIKKHVVAASAQYPVANNSDDQYAVSTTARAQKHSFFVKLFAKVKSYMPQSVYIALSILLLGWLAIGINDSWKGHSWWKALLFYILLIIPGMIYSLMQMERYYYR